MRTSSQSIIIASLVLPLFLVACDRSEKAPAAAGSSQTMKPAPQPAEPPMEKTPSSPADLSKNPAAPSSAAPSTTETAPADQKGEAKKEN